MWALDISSPVDRAPPPRPARRHGAEAETEDMPFAVHYDKPEPAAHAVWLALAAFAGILLAALV